MKFLFFSILLFISVIGNAQLSEKWEGHYIGELFSTNVKGVETSYHMELIIKEKSDSAYQWTIIYGADSLRQERDYTLYLIAGDEYQMDENNGILLNINLIDNKLISVFEVEGNMLHVSYGLSKMAIHFELTSSNNKSTTGGNTTDTGQEIPEIATYKTTTFQTASLKRQ